MLKISISQYLRQKRLEKGLELLQHTSSNVSEVAYKVGFGSATYFIKCFHDYFGYPPGEVGNRNNNEAELLFSERPGKKRLALILTYGFIIVLIAVVLFFVLKPFSFQQSEKEKSIAVLPILNYNRDSTDNFIAEGLREEIIDKLSIIKEISVISRTTSDTYKSSLKTIKEIAKELRVNYVLEGSAQTVNGNIRIRLQLFEANSEKPIWVNPYEREVTNDNIFEIQKEIAELVARGIDANITPSENKKIAFTGTKDKIAYTYYIQGLAIWRMFQREETLTQLYRAKNLFLKSIEQDSTFSNPMYELGWTLINETWMTKNSEKWDSAIIMADKAVKYNSQYAEGYNLKGFVTRHNEKEQLKAFDMGIKIDPDEPSNYGAYATYYFIEKRDYTNTIKYSFKVCEVKKEPIVHSTTLMFLSTSFAVMQFHDLADKYINLY